MKAPSADWQPVSSHELAMGIFGRMGKVISSNVNALIDRAEDPKKSIELLIDQMREQIRRGRQEVVSALGAEKQLQQRLVELDTQIDAWKRRAELAVKVGDEPLAREALVHKRRLSVERERAAELLAQQRAMALQLKDELASSEARLRELDVTKGTIAVRCEQARAGGGVEALGARGSGPNPFEEMRRIGGAIEQQSDRAQATQEAQAELQRPEGAQMTSEQLEQRFAALESQQTSAGATAAAEPDIDDELRSLRKKFRVAP